LPQNRKFQDFVETKYVAAGGIATADLADDAVTDAKTATTIEKTLMFNYNGVSKTTAAKTLTAADGTAQTLPAGVFIKSYLIESTQAFTSDGSATLALGYTGTAAGIMAATAFDNAAIAIATVGWELSATMGGAPNGTSGTHSVLLTIAGAAITAGRCNVYITYQENIV
tara:strand:- start:1899 stop:2405 length:507 start_codon:yes stop_codon:yes gene_type:complete